MAELMARVQICPDAEAYPVIAIYRAAPTDAFAYEVPESAMRAHEAAATALESAEITIMNAAGFTWDSQEREWRR